MNRLLVCLLLVLLSACKVDEGVEALVLGPVIKNHKKTGDYSYRIVVDVRNALAPVSFLEKKWHQEAVKLCNTQDIYYKTSYESLTFSHPQQTVEGVVYCNEGFVDTRTQAPDSAFDEFQQLMSIDFLNRDESELRALLNKRDYAGLQQQCENLYQQFKQGHITETQLAKAFATFDRIDDDTDKLLQEWADYAPDSAFAYYAKAEFYYSRSWYERGSGFSDTVTASKRLKLNKYNALAVTEIDKALANMPDFSLALALKLTLSLTGKTKDKTVNELFDEMVLLAPDSLSLHRTALNFLKPRWFGSEQEMRAFIDQAIAKNPKFEVLNTSYLIEQADQDAFANRYEAARLKYLQGVEAVPRAYTYEQLAYVTKTLGKPEQALGFYQKALERDPYSERSLNAILRLVLDKGDYLAALYAAAQLSMVNSLEPSYLSFQASILYAMRRYEDAKAYYEKALALEPKNIYYKHNIRKTEYQIAIRQSA